jgi:hypothetical protein
MRRVNASYRSRSLILSSWRRREEGGEEEEAVVEEGCSGFEGISPRGNQESDNNPDQINLLPVKNADSLLRGHHQETRNGRMIDRVKEGPFLTLRDELAANHAGGR